MNLIYTTHQKEISIKNYTDEIVIWFWGDVHRDTSSCDVERFKRFLKQSAADENAYYFGMGDYHDFMSTSEKTKIAAAHLHETTIQRFDEMVESANRSFCTEIAHMRGRLLGLIEGNHHWIYENGKSSTEDLAERMETPYLGWLCHFTLVINVESRDNTYAIHIVACHGRAGGKTYGITLNQVGDMKMIFPVADVYCMGHDHQRVADSISVLIPVNGRGGYKIKQKEQLLCRSGSFKKSYEPGRAGYEANKLLKPANLGALKVIINFNRKSNEFGDVTYTELSALV